MGGVRESGLQRKVGTNEPGESRRGEDEHARERDRLREGELSRDGSEGRSEGTGVSFSIGEVHHRFDVSLTFVAQALEVLKEDDGASFALDALLEKSKHAAPDGL